jgi:hypothetical protein
MQIGIDSFAAAISDPATGLTLSIEYNAMIIKWLYSGGGGLGMRVRTDTA